MLKLVSVLALLSAFATPAFAGPCVALDYQEMKDMPVNDLVQAACSAEAENDRNFDQVLANHDATRVAKPFPDAEQNQGVCNGQIDRMLRVLKSKGMTEKLHMLCKQQAAGKTITAPAEAK